MSGVRTRTLRVATAAGPAAERQICWAAKIMNPNEVDLYAGIAGTSLDVESFHFGDGIILSKTYAHLMAPFIMAFAPAEPGKPHPAPWKAIQGGFAFDVLAQLKVPKEFNPPRWFDHFNTVWWFAALLRLRATPLISVPVISSEPFSQAPEVEGIQFWPIEAEPRRLVLQREPPNPSVDTQNRPCVDV